MKRREFLTVGAGSIALATLPALPTLGAHEDGRTGFHFLTISAHTGGTDVLAMSGNGRVGSDRVFGGGVWDHLDNDPALPLPKPVLGTGRWWAARLISLNVIGTHGVLAAGTVEMEARFFEQSGIRFRGTIKVTCNLGFAGLSTGEPEGVTTEIPDFAITFVPTTFPGTAFPFGLTVLDVSGHPA
jgi:hypothetical protein